ncbi:MAG: hypothetical protein WKF88_03370 [Ferruginibacter sp.]
MNKLIAGYLFQHKKCAIQGLGTLEIRNTEAMYVAGQQTINAPIPEIHFTERVTDHEGLAVYLAADKSISIEEANYLLEKYGEELRGLGPGEKAEIPGAGAFSKDADDVINFIPVQLPAYFFPDVHAERVIHPDKSHSILVGDKETNSAAMAEFFAEDAPAGKKYWGIWAAVLMLAAAAILFFYMNDEKRNALFGIARSYEVPVSGDTYKKIP